MPDANSKKVAAGGTLAAAVSFAIAGVPVFPCAGKVPRLPRGLNSASTDPEQVAEWWSRWPDASIGLVTGAASGLIVLDVDVQHGGQGTLLELERKHGKLPKAAEVLTGGGGKHVYFRHPGYEVRNSAGRLGPGLDIRGDGGYVIAPPSVHASGREYKWLRPLGSVHPFDPPAWLLSDAAQRRNAPAPAVESVIPEGQRRQTLLSLAGSMRRRGMAADEIVAALVVVNNRRCRPPLPADELASLADDVASRYAGETPPDSFPPPIALETGGNEIAGGFAATPIESLVADVPPGPKWAWRGYLAPFALTLFAGRPKVGKSTFAFALLSKLAAGEPFVGRETVANGVHLLSEERRDTLAEKARILGLVSFPPRHIPSGGNEKKPVHVLTRHDAPAAAWPELVRQAMAYAHQHDLGVLVVDTWDRWTNLRGDNESAAGTVNEALEPLQYAAASGLAVLIVTHQRKSAGEFGDAVRGSNALTGGVGTVAELERPPPSLSLGKEARALRAVSRFSSTPDELFVELDVDEAAFHAIESPEEVKTAAERLKLLEALDATEATSKQLAETTGLPDSTVRRHLNALLEGGHVAREGEGKRGDPHRWRQAGEP